MEHTTCLLCTPELCTDEFVKAIETTGLRIKQQEKVEIGKDEVQELFDVNEEKRPPPAQPPSARGKKKPTKGKGEEEPTGPSVEDYVSSLTGKPIEYFILEGDGDATAALQTASTAPASEDEVRPLHAAVAACEVAYPMFMPSSSQAADEWIDLIAIFERERKELATALKKPKPKSPNVAIDDIMKFCFPPEIQHPRSTGRLIVFALYGPFNSEGKLAGGIKGSWCVSAVELKCMIDEEEKADILDVYVKHGKGLPADVKREVLVAVDAAAKVLPRMSKAQIKELLYDLPCPEPGYVVFHDLQKAVLQARERRKQDMKQMYPNLTSVDDADQPFIKQPPPKWGRKEAMKPDLEAQGLGTLGDNHFAVVSRMLHRESHGIVHLDEGNNSQVTQNVKLLRPESQNHTWDHLSCLKASNPGSYVGRTMRRHKK